VDVPVDGLAKVIVQQSPGFHQSQEIVSYFGVIYGIDNCVNQLVWIHGFIPFSFTAVLGLVKSVFEQLLPDQIG
jgi:hypothetical protein